MELNIFGHITSPHHQFKIAAKFLYAVCDEISTFFILNMEKELNTSANAELKINSPE
jgi:hypothetical protein